MFDFSEYFPDVDTDNTNGYQYETAYQPDTQYQ